MALAPLDRFAGPSLYGPVESLPRTRTLNDVAPIDRGAVDPNPVAPLSQQPPPAGLSSVDSLTSSARAAAVALATIPRDATATVGELQSAVAQTEDAALSALTDPFEQPTPRQVAQNFAAIAALVPSPQELVNDTLTAVDSGETELDVSLTTPAFDEENLPFNRGAPADFAGSRLSRFA